MLLRLTDELNDNYARGSTYAVHAGEKGDHLDRCRALAVYEEQARQRRMDSNGTAVRMLFCGASSLDALWYQLPRSPESDDGRCVMPSRVVEVVLPNKIIALVRAVEFDEGQPSGGAEKIGWKDHFDFDQVSGTLEGVAQAIRAGLQNVKPTRTTVELGIQLAVKSGKLTGVLVDGEANASLKVTLEWGNDQPDVGPDPS
jgi:hypothetical protein